MLMSSQETEITIRLLTGGIRLVELRYDEPRAIVIPRRSLLSHARQHTDKRKAVYLLLAAEAAKPRVYIGSTNDAWERLKVHFGNLKWWKTAIVLTSKGESGFSLDAINWLERRGIQMANETGCFYVENAYKRDEILISDAEEESLSHVFGSLRTLVSVLGYPVFEQEEHLLVATTVKGASYGSKAAMTAIKKLLDKGDPKTIEEIATTLGLKPGYIRTNVHYTASPTRRSARST